MNSIEFSWTEFEGEFGSVSIRFIRFRFRAKLVIRPRASLFRYANESVLHTITHFLVRPIISHQAFSHWIFFQIKKLCGSWKIMMITISGPIFHIKLEFYKQFFAIMKNYKPLGARLHKNSSKVCSPIKMTWKPKKALLPRGTSASLQYRHQTLSITRRSSTLSMS